MYASGSPRSYSASQTPPGRRRLAPGYCTRWSTFATLLPASMSANLHVERMTLISKRNGRRAGAGTLLTSARQSPHAEDDRAAIDANTGESARLVRAREHGSSGVRARLVLGRHASSGRFRSRATLRRHARCSICEMRARIPAGCGQGARILGCSRR
ncbi:hypothetical protein K466DRAFT_85951 [Polyporus arcularius HHB13444]|uniref:Uncharacterized protein n=1 Tax=Polyporus arcularius HHB13444 TaxID=1314778 RepID=A0A5C3NM98_9APHY|nr:hypothetical protein K466DRAFT_85951 [Polyporus arcularius HHB13444]